jgi:hypothetical protein
MVFLTESLILSRERRFIMEETRKSADMHKPFSRPELLDLYKHYWTVLLTELNFCHQYLNFYTGLLSAILAASILGFLNMKFGDLHALALLLGPVLIIVLAINGYATVATFYRRFAEAWVTTINLESMLRIRYPKEEPIQLDSEPLYLSNEDSFVSTYYWSPLKRFFEKAKDKQWRAERLAKELGRKGTTLLNAKITFLAYGIAAVLLAGLILLTTTIPSLFQK